MKKIKFLFVSALAVMAVSCASGETEQKKDDSAEKTAPEAPSANEQATASKQAQEDANEVFNGGNTITTVVKDHTGASPIVSPTTIKEFGRPTIIEFGATWCGPCKLAKPIVEKLASTYQGKAEFLYVDIDEHPTIAKEFGVGQSVPVVVVAKADGTFEKVEGLEPIQNELDSKIATVLK